MDVDEKKLARDAYWKGFEKEKEVRSLLQKKSALDKYVKMPIEMMVKKYQEVVDLDVNFAYEKEVMQSMWKIAFHKRIEAFRKKLRKPITELNHEDKSPSSSNDKEREERKHVKKSLETFLQRAREIFEQIVQKLLAQHNLDLSGVVNVWKLGEGDENDQEKQKAYFVVHQIMIFRGDIERYEKDIHAKGKDEFLKKAEVFYNSARVLIPENGNPYNQLAVLSTYTNEELAAVYFNCRSLSAVSPFPTARDNLATVFEKNKIRLVATEQSSQSSPEINQVDKFESQFVRLYGMLYLNNFDNYSDVKERALRLFEGSLKNQKIDQKRMTKILTIMIFFVFYSPSFSFFPSGSGSISSLVTGDPFKNLGPTGTQGTVHEQQLRIYNFACVLFMEFVAILCDENQINWSFPLLGQVSLVVEWLKIRSDVLLYPWRSTRTKSSDASNTRDQRELKSWLRMWESLVRLFNLCLKEKSEGDEAFSFALPEEVELRGFIPMAQVNLVDSKDAFGPNGRESQSERYNPKRMKKIVDAAFYLSSQKYPDLPSQSILIYDESTKTFFIPKIILDMTPITEATQVTSLMTKSEPTANHLPSHTEQVRSAASATDTEKVITQDEYTSLHGRNESDRHPEGTPGKDKLEEDELGDEVILFRGEAEGEGGEGEQDSLPLPSTIPMSLGNVLSVSSSSPPSEPAAASSLVYHHTSHVVNDPKHHSSTLNQQPNSNSNSNSTNTSVNSSNVNTNHHPTTQSQSLSRLSNPTPSVSTSTSTSTSSTPTSAGKTHSYSRMHVSSPLNPASNPFSPASSSVQILSHHTPVQPTTTTTTTTTTTPTTSSRFSRSASTSPSSRPVRPQITSPYVNYLSQRGESERERRSERGRGRGTTTPDQRGSRGTMETRDREAVYANGVGRRDTKQTKSRDRDKENQSTGQGYGGANPHHHHQTGHDHHQHQHLQKGKEISSSSLTSITSERVKVKENEDEARHSNSSPIYSFFHSPSSPSSVSPSTSSPGSQTDPRYSSSPFPPHSMFSSPTSPNQLLNRPAPHYSDSASKSFRFSEDKESKRNEWKEIGREKEKEKERTKSTRDSFLNYDPFLSSPSFSPPGSSPSSLFESKNPFL